MLSYDDSDGFPVAHKVEGRFPACPLHNLCGGPGVVHSVGGHNVVAIWGPVTPQHVGCATALSHNSGIIPYSNNGHDLCQNGITITA